MDGVANGVMSKSDPPLVARVNVLAFGVQCAVALGTRSPFRRNHADIQVKSLPRHVEPLVRLHIVVLPWRRCCGDPILCWAHAELHVSPLVARAVTLPELVCDCCLQMELDTLLEGQL